MLRKEGWRKKGKEGERPEKVREILAGKEGQIGRDRLS